MADKKIETAEKYLRVIDTKKHIVINNFLGGISWALGTIVGFLIISIISVVIIGQTGVLTQVGSWLSNVIENSQKSVIPKELEEIGFTSKKQKTEFVEKFFTYNRLYKIASGKTICRIINRNCNGRFNKFSI